MNIDYISILILLLLTQWTFSLSLHSLFYPNEKKLLDYQNFKVRWPSIERLRRWSQSVDHDEIEIPINETPLLTTQYDQSTIFNSIDNMTTFQTTEFNRTNFEKLTEEINSTMITIIENITEIYPLLRHDFIDMNQTTISIIEDTLLDNQTEMNKTNFSSIINEENSEKNFQISSTINHQIELTSSIQDYQLTTLDFLSNETLSTIETNQEWFIHSNLSLKDAIIININETEIITNSTDISILSTIIPICDRSCQCTKECPYGYEIINDTCLCDPPCKNYQCFNNDTCIVSDNGQPLCQRQNGIEHERPIRCYQPRDAGYHDINLRYYSRWYYNPDQDTCHLFVYRGLGGNENNFLTLHQCHSECITCAPLPDPGECFGHINMWYFDRKANRCKQFEYSGCKGNENKFLKEEHCIDICINRMINL